MKAKFIFIVLSKLLIDVSLVANAQQTNSPLSAMKDSFFAFASTQDDGVTANPDYGFPVLCAEATSNECPPSDAFIVISKMTEQVRSDVEVKRVRVVSPDARGEQAKKQDSKGSKKEKS